MDAKDRAHPRSPLRRLGAEAAVVFAFKLLAILTLFFLFFDPRRDPRPSVADALTGAARAVASSFRRNCGISPGRSASRSRFSTRWGSSSTRGPARSTNAPKRTAAADPARSGAAEASTATTAGVATGRV